MVSKSNLKNELKQNQVVLLVVPRSEYAQSMLSLTHCIKNEKICYITLNKTAKRLSEELRKNKVDLKNVLFIDCITATLKQPEPLPNIVFVPSPNALTKLGIEVTKALKTAQLDHVIFDSLSTLLVYGDHKRAARFLNFLIEKTRGSNVKFVFTCLKGDAESDAVRRISMHVDKILNLDKK